MTAADEARAEGERRWWKGTPESKRFAEGAEWQASRPITDAQVEAAAKAIWDAEPYVPEYEGDTGVAWEDAGDSQRDIWRTGARAALEAARGVQP